MNNWEGLRDVLSNIPGVVKVYFQPPENVKLVFPCIIFERSSGRKNQADDNLYLYRKSYEVTVIDKRAESPISDEVLKLPFTSFNRCFVSDNLHHYVYTIYY